MEILNIIFKKMGIPIFLMSKGSEKLGFQIFCTKSDKHLASSMSSVPLRLATKCLMFWE